MANQFFSMLSRMKLINRWGLMRNTRNENISEHSHETAIIAHALAVIHNKHFGGNADTGRAALLGIFHDTTEIITGDLPTPVKYHNPALRDAYKHVEDNAKSKLLSMLPIDLQNEYRVLLAPGDNISEEEKLLWGFVKAADKISALVKCIEERTMGNSDFISAERATLKSIKKLNMPEAEYFLEHFLPSYGLTLDDQTNTKHY